MDKIFDVVSEIEKYIDSCKFVPLSTSKIIVDKDEIDKLLIDLRCHIKELKENDNEQD